MRTQSTSEAATQLPHRSHPRRLVRGLSIGSVGVVMLTVIRAANAATITVNASTSSAGNPHFWSNTVGTGTATLTLRSDLQTHYQIANRELGFLHVRGHGVLSDGMGIYKGAGSYDFSKFDTYLDAIAAAGMRPSMELSFMPTALGKNGSDKDPPKDLTAYTAFIKAVVQHCVDKYGADDVAKWNWEVWNEPNYSGFWNGTYSGTSNDYFTMYDAAVAGAAAALPNIQIGGPAATQGAATFLQAFLTHTKSANVRVTFVASHSYSGDCKASLDANSVGVSDNDSRVAAIKAAGYTTDAIRSLNSEWNSSYGGQGGSTDQACVSMDTHVNAPFIVKTVKLLSDKNVGNTAPLDMFSYWVVSDVFDESSGPSGSYILSKTAAGTLPFGSVFGLTTFQGMRKAAYNGFRMLNYLGPKLLKATGGSGTADGVDAMAASSDSGDEVQIIVYNQYKTPATTGTDDVTLTISNLPTALANKSVYVTHFRVDETHSNPYSVWSSQNKPSAPTETQWQAMRAAQQLALMEPVTQKAVTTSYTATISLAKQGASLIILGVNRPVTGRDALTTMEGEDYDGQSGGTKEDSGDTSMGQSISVTAGGSLFFNNVDFSDQGVGSVTLRVKAQAATTLELHADTATGPLVGTCAIAAATAWATQTCTLTQTTGVHNLYLSFAGAAHLNWMTFTGVACTGTSCSSGTGGATSVSTGGSSTAGGAGSATGGTKTNGGTSGNAGGNTSSSAVGGKSATGGSVTAGGAVATGGTGVSSNGGATTASGGASPSVGGGNAAGGVGGNAVGGGPSNVGGMAATGGIASNVGGAAATGGAPTVGGAGAVGGASSGNTSPTATNAGDSNSGGCGCRVPAHQNSPLGTTGRLALLGLVGFGLWRRKRSQTSTTR